MRVLVLEDNRDRRVAMIGRMADRFPFVQMCFYDASAAMIDAMESSSLDDVALLSLDHDLDLIPGVGQQWIDPGTGLEVAEWLAGLQNPKCPVVIQTTNSLAGDRMTSVLQEKNWKVFRVVPHDDLAWIDSDWFPAVRNAIVEYSPKPILPTASPGTNKTSVFRSILDYIVPFIGRRLRRKEQSI